jgi:hypothetical protein
MLLLVRRSTQSGARVGRWLSSSVVVVVLVVVVAVGWPNYYATLQASVATRSPPLPIKNDFDDDCKILRPIKN